MIVHSLTLNITNSEPPSNNNRNIPHHTSYPSHLSLAPASTVLSVSHALKPHRLCLATPAALLSGQDSLIQNHPDQPTATMTNSSKLFSFSDEFTEWAKQEDMVNNQMNSNWIPAYVIITLIPIGFIISAALASRKETKRQASERAARAARIGELLPLWLRDMVATRSANNDSQAATGTERHGSNGIELTDLEAGLAKRPGEVTMPNTAAAAAAPDITVTAPTDPRPRARADSLSSDTGAVIDGGATHGAGDANPPRRQRRRGPSTGRQPQRHERAVAGPSRGAQRRTRRRTLWPSFAE